MVPRNIKTKTYRKRLVPFYCKTKKGDKEICIGVEIGEGIKTESDPKEMIQAEGRVVMRFFNTSMGKDTQIRYQMEAWEAYDAYLKILEVAKSPVAIKRELTPHSFTRDDTKVVTNVTFEKWVRGDRSGYAIIAISKGISHNVSLQKRSQFLFAGEMLKFLSCVQGWADVLMIEGNGNGRY